MVETISIDQLTVGMFVVEAGSGTFEDPTTKIQMQILHKLEILALKKTGVLYVVVDWNKSDLPDDSRKLKKDHEKFHDDVRQIDKRIQQAVAYSRSMMEDVRLGKSINPSDAAPVVDTILTNIFQNESAALFLTKLGTYDDYTYMHCVNVSVLASIFGRHLGMDGTELYELGLSALFHDLGKALIPASILNKPGKLTADERAVMKAHPLKGYNLLKDIPGLSREVLNGMLQHHEKWSGAGYPKGLQGAAISEFARILAVVDVYDAMTSDRVYHKKRAETDVLGFLFKEKNAFAPGYVERFVKVVGIYPPGTLVRLSTGTLAMVCQTNQDDTLNPWLNLVSDDMKVSSQCFLLNTLNDGGEVKIVEVMDHLAHQVDLSSLQN